MYRLLFSVYEGEVLEGLRHGFGTFHCGHNKLSYTGEWRKGRKHGKVSNSLPQTAVELTYRTGMGLIMAQFAVSKWHKVS